MSSYRLWLVRHGTLEMNEAVILVSIYDFMTLFNKSYVQSDLVAAENIEHFVDILSDVFSKHNITFKYDESIQELECETHPNGTIIIYIYPEFLRLFRRDPYKFNDELQDILKHELIHREQFGRIDLDKYKGISIPDNLPEEQKGKKYLSHKIEMMAFVRNIVDQLTRRFKTKSRLLQFLKNPVPYNSDILDSYLVNFKDDKKTLDQLYKYMYQYIINDFDKKEMG